MLRITVLSLRSFRRFRTFLRNVIGITTLRNEVDFTNYHCHHNMFKTEREKYYRDRLEMSKRMRLESGGYVVPAIVAPARRTYRRTSRNNLSGTPSAAWNKQRDNAKKPQARGIPRALKTAIKAVLNQEAEWKLTRGSLPSTARGTIAAADVAQWMPGITQGAGNGQRIGDEVNIKSAKFDIMISPSAATNPAPFKCRILIFRPQDRGNKPFDATMAAAFYDNGSGSFAGTGVWLDQVAVPNPEYFEVLYDKLTPVMQWTTSVPTAADADTNLKLPYNQYHYSVDVPYCCGKVKYSDTSTDPSKYVWMVIQACDTNTLSSTNAAGVLVAETYVQATFQYLDC